MDAPKTKSRTSYYVAGILFALIIGGLAFVIQFLPNWRTQTINSDPAEKKRSGPGVCRFTTTRGIWDKAEKDYLKEIEKKDRGHFDFSFDNPSDDEGEMGLFLVNCACSAVLVGFPSEEAWSSWTESLKSDPAAPLPENAVSTWTRLIKEDEVGKVTSSDHAVQPVVKLPPRCKGVVRLAFEGKGEGGANLRLNPRIWVQPAGYPKERFIATFEVGVRVTNPILYFPMQLKLGSIAPGGQASAECFVWSATRPKAEVRFRDEKPLFEVSVRPLNEKEKLDLKQTIAKEEKFLTNVQSAWAVTVTVHEEKKTADGKLVQHDLGPFLHNLRFQVDEEPFEQGPDITGTIASDIEVGEIKDRGRVDLGTFDPERGTERRLYLWSDGKVKLAYERHEPSEIKVKFTHLVKESSPKRNKWQLDVTVPRDSIFGTFPEQSAVYLRLHGPTSRLIRLPVVGTAKLTRR